MPENLGSTWTSVLNQEIMSKPEAQYHVDDEVAFCGGFGVKSDCNLLATQAMLEEPLMEKDKHAISK